MKILFLSAEVSPFAKVGGLADVAGSLPKALHDRGHDVRVMMPSYRMIEEDARWGVRDVLRDVKVRLNPKWTKTAYVKQAAIKDVPVYLVGTDEWFTEADRSEKVYTPGVEQYLFFSQAVLECCEALEWMPDVVHCNDWHTGFVPVLMREKAGSIWDDAAAVFTIHNLAYQGEFGPEVLDKLDLPMSLFNMQQLETFGFVNFLKAGCVYSDHVNTVSPSYAREIQTAEYGCRLEGLMRHLYEEGRLRGILNGIDYEEFDPSSDPRIPANFSASDATGKASCRSALLEELGLPFIDGAPLMGVVSRLSSQKGIDLIVQAFAETAALPAQVVILGTGDHSLAADLRRLQEEYPKHLRFIEKFDIELAQRIYAGCDVFLMPSSFEPCGLGQMIAFRYGTVPVARHTGGLADTVFENENGFVFYERAVDDYLAAVKRCFLAFNGDRWDDLVQRALRSEHGWTKSAISYEEMYEEALGVERLALGVGG
jgi:starch synthase